MNGNAELLNFIYQNSQMGVETIGKLLEIIESEEFKKQLESQFNEYKEIHISARSMLNEHGYDEKGIGTFAKIRTYLMLNLETLTDKTTSHIAEMLIIGSNMGVINALKNLKKYQDAEPDIKSLMERLLRFEEHSIEKLKLFL
ncbi:MAG: hypothetical protein ACOX6E_00580 [Syntrophomonadaceae bacterium]|jgi:hypothetical protein